MAQDDVIADKGKTEYSLFHQEVVGLRSAFARKHQGDIKIDEALMHRRSSEGKHLIDTEAIRIDENHLNELFEDFIPILKKHQSLFDFQIQDLEEKKEKIDLGRLVRSFLAGDFESLKSMARELGLNPDMLSFLGLNLAQTFFGFFAEKFQDKIDRESWFMGNCPLCGSFPAMEKLRRDDGKRVLWCGLCSTQWPYKRIMCPFCGNEDHNSLRYFFTEGDSSSDKTRFRVDVCDKCKKYIKTIDERKMPEDETPDFSKENINTLYLDILAQKDGYQSPTYWMIV
jgi:FdhE protein